MRARRFGREIESRDPRLAAHRLWICRRHTLPAPRSNANVNTKSCLLRKFPIYSTHCGLGAVACVGAEEAVAMLQESAERVKVPLRTELSSRQTVMLWGLA